MALNTHSEAVLQLAREKGLLRPLDLVGAGIPRIYLTRLTNSGELERAARGLYRLPERPPSDHDGMALVAARVPQAVFCLLTALHFHELTTQTPDAIWIAMPRGSHAPRLEHPTVKMVQFSGAGYERGIEVFERARTPIRVYGIAKTIADCFKHRSKIGLDVALEALKDAWSRRQVTADELWDYARQMRVASVMRPYLEAVV
ncbi:MAG: type IV toxin-antitoxin system AbiEi family antitoxin domain-containing protein [Gammaproteobacteria bacterium]